MISGRHPLPTMMNNGLLVTVNSDNPAYFGGYVNEDYVAVQHALGLSEEDLAQLARNSLDAAFLTVEEKRALGCRVSNYVAARAVT
jgi:adenosine deaminase